MPSGTIPTTHILKPGIQGLADQDLNEHLCLDAARRAGLHELAEIAPDAFSAAAAAPEVQALASDLPDTLVDLVADRARRCLELLDQSTAAANSSSAPGSLSSISPEQGGEQAPV